jgi:hypothetical protein
VALLGRGNTLAGQFRALEAAAEHGVAAGFQPFTQQGDLCRAPHAIRPLKDNELAGQMILIEARQALAIEIDRGH